MKLPKLHPLVWKTPIVVFALGTLAAVSGNAMFPQLPLLHRLGVAALLAGAVFVVLVVAAVIFATVMQWILRRGGTDADWFWFNGEPPGLRQLREQAKAGREGLPPQDRAP
jgi:hypothetical protein